MRVAAGAAKKMSAASQTGQPPTLIAPKKARKLPTIGTKARKKPRIELGQAPQLRAC